MGTTVLSPGIKTTEREDLTPAYNVVLLDDDDHTYDYVIEMLQMLFVFSQEQAVRHAVEVDTTGRTVVITCERPQAEYARDQIHGYGADPRMPKSSGSMKAVIQPVSGGSG